MDPNLEEQLLSEREKRSSTENFDAVSVKAVSVNANRTIRAQGCNMLHIAIGGWACWGMTLALFVLLFRDCIWDGRGNGIGEGQKYTDKTCIALCEPVCITMDEENICFKNCYNGCIEGAKNLVRPGALGDWILPQAIQHVGVTTSNLSKSVAFYTNVMGGVEVLNAGGNGWRGDDVYQLLMQAAIIRGGEAASFAANLSAAGSSQLDARYVSFGSMIVELLDYHSDEAVLQRSLFPKFSESNVAPSVAGNMHISFNVRPEKNLNDFVVALEGSAHERGFDEVLCNRLVPVKKDNATGRPNVKGVPVSDNSFEVTGGAFQGWSLAYCKGPDGEQLEFNQVKGKAKGLFDDALRTYLSGGENKLW